MPSTLQVSNYEPLELLTFRKPGRSSALISGMRYYMLWEKLTKQDSDIFRRVFYDPNSYISFYLARRKQKSFMVISASGNWQLLLLLSHFSRVRLCATPQTAAHQAPPSLGFSKQEHWSGLPFPSPGNWQQTSAKSMFLISCLLPSSKSHIY